MLLRQTKKKKKNVLNLALQLRLPLSFLFVCFFTNKYKSIFICVVSKTKFQTDICLVIILYLPNVGKRTVKCVEAFFFSQSKLKQIFLYFP